MGHGYIGHSYMGHSYVVMPQWKCGRLPCWSFEWIDGPGEVQVRDGDDDDDDEAGAYGILVMAY